MQLRKKPLFLLALAVINIVASPIAQAQLTPSDYMQNDIVFSNEDECGPTDEAAVPSAPFDGNLKAAATEILMFYTEKAGMTLKQAAAIAGNFQQESTFNPAAENPDSGAYGLAQWLDRKDALLAYAKEAGTPHDSMQTQLNFTLHELYGKEHVAREIFVANSETASVSELAIVFGKAYERYGSSEEGDRGANAAKIYDEFKGQIRDGAGMPDSLLELQTRIPGLALTDKSSQSSTRDKCATNGSGGSGMDIAKEAVRLSWSDDSHGGTPKPEYRTSLEKYGYKANACDSPPAPPGSYGADCGVFVSTTLRNILTDSSIPHGGTSAFEKWLGESENWESVPNTGSTDSLKPGDIFVVNLGSGAGADGHIKFYVGDVGQEDGGKNAAQASCWSHTGQRGWDITFSDRRGDYKIFRLKDTAFGGDGNAVVEDVKEIKDGWHPPIKSPSHITRRKEGNHTGIDAAANLGDWYLAMRDGEVIVAGNGDFMTHAACLTVGFGDIWKGENQVVYLKHDNVPRLNGTGTETLYTRYSHMAPGSVQVKVGQKVKAGTRLGQIGESGCTTGPHVHIDVATSKPNDNLYIYRNPADYIGHSW